MTTPFKERTLSVSSGTVFGFTRICLIWSEFIIIHKNIAFQKNKEIKDLDLKRKVQDLVHTNIIIRLKLGFKVV